MLFYGPPGTGKTSTVLALAKELFGPELMRSRVLELNASDERGISIVREKVKDFARAVVSAPSEHARKNYPCPPYKIIILDEADSMTGDAQAALRRTMETYSSITRFCLICNYVTRIIDPLASRCSKFRFKPLDNTNSLERLQYISQAENLKYQPEALSTLLQASDGDLRKSITLLQSAARLHSLGGSLGAKDSEGDVELTDEDVEEGNQVISVETINEISGTVPEETIDGLLSVCRPSSGPSDMNFLFNKIQTAVENVILAGWNATQLISQLHDKLLESEYLDAKKKSAISWFLSEVDERLNDGSDEHLEILQLLTKVASVVNR
jgi:replication factor C subunit 2/4